MLVSDVLERPGIKFHVFLSLASLVLILAPSTSPQLSNWPAREVVDPAGGSSWTPELCGASQGVLAGLQPEFSNPRGAKGCDGHMGNFTTGEGRGTFSLSGK